jgi:hypothetical protein
MSTLLVVNILKREHILHRPLILVMFGDNVIGEGYGGQARECRGLHNCQGVVTKYSPQRFLSDSAYDQVVQMNVNAFARALMMLNSDGIVAIPYQGFGTGRAELKQRAPGIFGQLEKQVAVLHNRAKRVIGIPNLTMAEEALQRPK